MIAFLMPGRGELRPVRFHHRHLVNLNSSIIPSLVVTPLTFLGGAFYSIDMLPQPWRTVSLFNPVVYLVGRFRWSFYGVGDVGVAVSLAFVVAFMVLCSALRCGGFPHGLPPGSREPARSQSIVTLPRCGRRTATGPHSNSAGNLGSTTCHCAVRRQSIRHKDRRCRRAWGRGDATRIS